MQNDSSLVREYSAIRIGFVTALVTMAAGTIAIWKAGVLGAGQVGFSLANATGLSSIILNLERNMNELEVELQSVSSNFFFFWSVSQPTQDSSSETRPTSIKLLHSIPLPY